MLFYSIYPLYLGDNAIFMSYSTDQNNKQSNEKNQQYLSRVGDPEDCLTATASLT